MLAGQTELHPIATDVATAEAVDLHRVIEDPRSLRLALRASASLPLLAGPPVRDRRQALHRRGPVGRDPPLSACGLTTASLVEAGRAAAHAALGQLPKSVV